MGSREEETSYQRDAIERKTREKEATQKEVIDAIPKKGSTSMPQLTTDEQFLQFMKDMEDRRKVDLEKQNQFHSDLLKAMQEKPSKEAHPRIKLLDFLHTGPLSFSRSEERRVGKEC